MSLEELELPFINYLALTDIVLFIDVWTVNAQSDVGTVISIIGAMSRNTNTVSLDRDQFNAVSFNTFEEIII